MLVSRDCFHRTIGHLTGVPVPGACWKPLTWGMRFLTWLRLHMTCDARAEGSGANAAVLMALGGIKSLDDAWRLRDAVRAARCPLLLYL